MLRFIHITDTHIGPRKDFLLYGLESYPRLVKLVEEINSLPFKPSFIIHSGDVVDDGSDASYRLAREVLSKLEAPVFYVLGNHDEPDAMQSVLLGQSPNTRKQDSTASFEGIQFLFLDTRGPKSPAGELTGDQLQWLQEQCTPDGPPLVIVMHHSAIPLDTPWLDHGGKSWGGKTMLLSNHEEFRSTIAPARNRIKAVLYGHVHGSFQVLRDGILYIAAPSAFAQLENWPGAEEALLDKQPAGYNIVTIDDGQILIRNRIVR